jgi:hypothetical protein
VRLHADHAERWKRLIDHACGQVAAALAAGRLDELEQAVAQAEHTLAPIGEVAGMTMILETPAKLDPLIVGPWHATQLLVMPLWLMREPLNFAPLPTGVAAMLEPAPTWHTSHEALLGM